jgi:hypothetical protein
MFDTGLAIQAKLILAIKVLSRRREDESKCIA